MSTQPDHQWIDLDGTVNARTVAAGVLLRSDNLQELTALDVARLIEDHGLEVVIDLRTEVEVWMEGPTRLADEGSVRIEYHSLYPAADRDSDLDASTIQIWGAPMEGEFADEAPVVRAYLSYMARRPDSIVSAVSAIARADGAVLVHCAAGKDRTGLVVALALEAVGVERSVVVADYVATAQRIEQVMARLLSSSTYRAELEGHNLFDHTPQAQMMERVLEILDSQSGGAAAWLMQRGLSSTDLERLRERLTPRP